MSFTIGKIFNLGCLSRANKDTVFNTEYLIRPRDYDMQSQISVEPGSHPNFLNVMVLYLP